MASGSRAEIAPAPREKPLIPGADLEVDIYDALKAGDERAMEGLELPEGSRVVTVCNRGHSGAVAAKQLRRQGYEAYCLEGGLEAWKGL